MFLKSLKILITINGAQVENIHWKNHAINKNIDLKNLLIITIFQINWYHEKAIRKIEKTFNKTNDENISIKYAQRITHGKAGINILINKLLEKDWWSVPNNIKLDNGQITAQSKIASLISRKKFKIIVEIIIQANQKILAIKNQIEKARDINKIFSINCINLVVF